MKIWKLECSHGGDPLYTWAFFKNKPDEQYEVLIDTEDMTPARRRKVLLTLGDRGYRKYHTNGYRWIIGWY